MKITAPHSFKAEKAWQALDIANLDGVTVRMHWTDQPYRWHVNDGREVFVVLDGKVKMHHRDGGTETVWEMGAGDICYCGEGEEHFAEPVGPAYVLVVEREGSV